MFYYIYVLQSASNGQWYTGFTSNLRKRFKEHNDGVSKYTASRGPYRLIYYEACTEVDDAIQREKYLKSGPVKRFLSTRLKRFQSHSG